MNMKGHWFEFLSIHQNSISSTSDILIADLGTKALAALKLEELKKAMGMTDRKIKTEKEKEDLGVVRGPTEEKEENGVVREPAIETKEAKGGIKSPKDMVRMAMIMAMLSRAKAEDEDGDAGEESSIFFDMMMVYTIVVVLVTLAIQSGWQRRLLRAETAVGSDRSRGELTQRSARTSGLMTDGPTSVPGETVLGFGGGDQSRDEPARGSSQLLGSARTSGLTSQTGGPTSLPGETVLGFGRGDQSRDELPRRSGQPSGSARTSGLASQTDCPTSPPGETVLGFGGGDQSRDELPRRSGPPLKEEKEETPKAVKRAKSMGPVFCVQTGRTEEHLWPTSFKTGSSATRRSNSLCRNPKTSDSQGGSRKERSCSATKSFAIKVKRKERWWKEAKWNDLNRDDADQNQPCCSRAKSCSFLIHWHWCSDPYGSIFQCWPID